VHSKNTGNVFKVGLIHRFFVRFIALRRLRKSHSLYQKVRARPLYFFASDRAAAELTALVQV
jgi:hypothetical protein